MNGTRTCPSCAETVPAQSAQCPYCGENLAAPPVPVPSPVAGPAPRLRPMSVTEILDSAFRLYRQNFAMFLGILACAYLPVVGLVIAGVLVASTQAAARTDLAMITMLVAAAGNLLLAVFATPLATGALTRAVGDRYLDQPTSIGKCYGHIFRMFVPYLGTILLNGITIVAGFCLCIVPGILFAIWFAFTSSVCVLEGAGGTTAMGRSRRLAQGHEGRIFGMWVLIFILNSILGCAVGAFSGFALPQLVHNPVLQIALQKSIEYTFNMLLTPFFSIAWILLYYDIRIRKEGFDLEVLAKSMGSPAGFFGTR